jgi:pimeloyl-ACP methyl ester carboxylesterase
VRVDIGGCRLFFDVEGAKLRPDGPRMREVPTVLLLHGGPGADHSIFKPAYSQLADVAQVVYFDHRGDGRSDGRDDSPRWKLSQWGNDVKALCDALEIERPIVMGVSFGGYVAMSYALRYPDHPAKLILCSTTASPSKKDIQVEVFERLGGAEAGAAARAFLEDPTRAATREFLRLCGPLYRRSSHDPHINTRTIWNPRLMAEFRRGERETMNFLPELHRIKCQTLVMVGEDDPMTPVPCSEEIVAALPPDLVRFERFAGAGHGIVADQPDRFFEVLRAFIAA